MNPTVLAAFQDEGAAKDLVQALHQNQQSAQCHLGTGSHPFVVSGNPTANDEAQRVLNDFLVSQTSDPHSQSPIQDKRPVFRLGQYEFYFVRELLNFRGTPFTFFVFLACALVFAAVELGVASGLNRDLQIQSWSALIDNNQWWRLFTPVLIHYSVWHLLFNLLCWWGLGGQIERRLGTMTLVAVFLTAALIPNLGQFIWAGGNFGGLSGVAYAVLGFVWLRGVFAPSAGLELPHGLMWLAVLWLAIGFTDYSPVSMANIAHLGGLMTGLGLAAVYQMTFKKAV